jgi:drug/metabolite transporter (DMT)-like permease
MNTASKNVLIGCLAMVSGMFFFGITNAVAKGTGNELPLSEIIFFRSSIATLIMLLFSRYQKTHNLLATTDIKTQLFRGLLGFGQLYFLYCSFSTLPMADATAIGFATTLFVTALAGPFLKEKVGLARWSATLVGFIGVLVISKPSGVMNMTGVMAGLLSAFLEAMVMLYSSKLGKHDKAFTTVFYYTATTCVIGGLCLPFVWVCPTLEQFGLIALLGVAGTLGHILIARSYQLAPAAVVAPMCYTLMIWGMVFGYIFWQEVPGIHVLLGAGVIIACGLFIVYQEHGKKQRAMANEGVEKRV